MAKVKRTKTRLGKRVKAKKKTRPELDFTLPTEYIEPSGSLNDYSFLFHGEKKVGKTTLANQGDEEEEGILFLQNDPPQKAYRRMEMYTPTWEHSKRCIELLERDCPYMRVVVDGADQWYQRCMRYVCAKMAIEHPQDEPWGKGWDALRREFTDAVDRLLALPCGVWFLCHSIWREIENRHGNTVEKLLPRLPGQAEEVLNGKVDAWFAYDFDGKDRVIILEADMYTGAGHRLDDLDGDNPHFRDEDGNRLQQIQAGRSPAEAYAALEAAFYNTYTNPEPKKEKKRPKKKAKKKVRRKKR